MLFQKQTLKGSGYPTIIRARDILTSERPRVALSWGVVIEIKIEKHFLIARSLGGSFPRTTIHKGNLTTQPLNLLECSMKWSFQDVPMR